MLNEIITKWLGEEEQRLPNDTWNEWEQGKYQDLQDLKSRIPELEEMIKNHTPQGGKD